MAALIGFLLGEFEFEFFVLGLICAVASILRGRRPAGERLLAFYVLFSIGALNFVNFIYHVFFGEMSARFIGWPDSPFQTELGFASLGFALVGFLAWRGSYGMRVAAVLGPAPFLLGAGGGHIYQIMQGILASCSGWTSSFRLQACSFWQSGSRWRRDRRPERGSREQCGRTVAFACGRRSLRPGEAMRGQALTDPVRHSAPRFPPSRSDPPEPIVQKQGGGG
jgi:hypothetical protein